MSDNRLLRLIQGGIVLSGTLLSLSLFCYFQPEITNTAVQSLFSAVFPPQESKQQTQMPEQAEEFNEHNQVSNPEENVQDSDTPSFTENKADSTPFNLNGQSYVLLSNGTLVANADIADSEASDYGAWGSNPLPNGEFSDFSAVSPNTGTSISHTAVLDTSMGAMLYYNQGDSRWRDYLYGGSDPMKKYGCGPTVAAMLINSFARTPDSAQITPPQMADWAAANGFHARHNGSYHGLIQAAANAHGLNTISVTNRSYENAVSLLSSGHILVALMGKGTFTDNGHFILITKLLGNGKVSVADPNSYENCTKEWDLNLILSELKKSYDSGGPLWAVSF